jgi:asparagine synthase (glutamine-hydrolysing)
MTAEHVKVALSGDGADEILAGYDTYRANRFAHYYRLVPPTLRQKLIAPVARRIPISDRKYNLHQMLNRFVNGAEEGPGRDHCSWRIMLGSRLKECLYTGAFRERTNHLDPIGRYADALDGPPESFEALSNFLHADTTFYLPNDMLVKVDRMSMAHGLEVRVPFLDKDLVAFCANLPADAKLHRGKIRKHILRESMRGRFSNGLLDRPKSGFNVPIEAWMRQPRMKELLMDLVLQNDTYVGKCLQTEAIEKILAEHTARRADHGHALVTILMFALWCQNITSQR